jgi:hypothetical protein
MKGITALNADCSVDSRRTPSFPKQIGFFTASPYAIRISAKLFAPGMPFQNNSTSLYDSCLPKSWEDPSSLWGRITMRLGRDQLLWFTPRFIWFAFQANGRPFRGRSLPRPSCCSLLPFPYAQNENICDAKDRICRHRGPPNHTIERFIRALRL